MAFFKRFADIVKANINDMLNKAEDPEKMLPMIIKEMEEQYLKAKDQVAQAIVDQKKLESQYRMNLNQSQEWQRKATFALKQGNENLAKEALLKKKGHDETAEIYKEQYEDQTKAVEKLKAQLTQLEAKLEEAKRKKNILMAQARRADTLRQINETMEKASDTSAFDTFSRMEEKVKNKESHVEAYEELGGDKSLEDQFKELESSSSSVDDELDLLKAQMMENRPPTSSAPRADKPKETERLAFESRPLKNAAPASKEKPKETQKLPFESAISPRDTGEKPLEKKPIETASKEGQKEEDPKEYMRRQMEMMKKKQ